METCAAITQRYADLARQLANQAKQIASAADDAERLVPAPYIPTRRWQSDYDRALQLNEQSLQISRLGEAAFESCAETTVSAQRQTQSTPGRAIPGADTSSRRRTRLAPVEAP
jgi:predicted amidophosphoribosyltransferase